MMKAAVVEELYKVACREVPEPELLAGSLKIKVHACAVCGSDMRIFTKGDPRATLPRIIGHEIAGEVVEVGAQVQDRFRVGQRVCVAPIHGCGECKYCKAGVGNICIHPRPSIGYASSGGYAQYIVPPESVVRVGGVNPIPDGLSYEEASMSELLATCINAQEKTATRPGDTVLILGAGPAGCMHVQLARSRGAAKVIIAQHSRYRLEIARRFGPDVLICMDEEDIAARVKEETEGLGADVIIVAAPSPEAQELAFTLAAPGARINFFGGLPKDNHQITISGNAIHYQEYVVTGASSSLGRQNAEALGLIAAGKVEAAKYITHRFALEDVAQAYQAVLDKKSIKTVVFPWGLPKD